MFTMTVHYSSSLTFYFSCLSLHVILQYKNGRSLLLIKRYDCIFILTGFRTAVVLGTE